MGKSFNDDVFNNNILDSINGLTISKEAIEENTKPKKEKSKLNIKDIINIDDIQEKMKEVKNKEKIDPQDEALQLLQEQERLNEREKEQKEQTTITYTKNVREYIKRTMIIKQEYLDIIEGLTKINEIQQKDVFNQLLEKAISLLDEKTREKALKVGKKINQEKAKEKESKSIF